MFRFVLSLLASTPPQEMDILTPRPPTPLRAHYDWEELDIVPQHVADQLHNTVKLIYLSIDYIATSVYFQTNQIKCLTNQIKYLKPNF